VKYKLTIDGKTYEVDLEPIEQEARRPEHVPLPGSVPRSAPQAAGFPPAAAPPGGAPVDEAKVCRSPIAGVVVRVSAQVGQAIQANDVLMVLEAMKMETTITSPVAGKVAKVNAGVGDPVQGGQVLVEFE
jgi:biotin carboxyl carrier protein